MGVLKVGSFPKLRAWLGWGIPSHPMEVELEDTGWERRKSSGEMVTSNDQWSLPMTSEAGGECSLEADPRRKNLRRGLGTVALIATVNSNYPDFQREWRVPEQAPRQNGTFPFYCVCRKWEMD